MSEISITYDLLFDILRTEKSRDDLQKLDERFYKNVVEYINSKESVISNPNTPNGERELTKIQLGNVKKILLELYDRREKKIINLSIYKIKTSSGMISTDSLLEEERILFDKIYSELYRHRIYTINNMVEGRMAATETLSSIIPSRSDAKASSSSSKAAADAQDDADSDDSASGSIKSVRFTKPVPKFLGPELEIYGPFEEDDIASLPSKIADILIRKERAENMNIE